MNALPPPLDQALAFLKSLPREIRRRLSTNPKAVSQDLYLSPSPRWSRVLIWSLGTGTFLIFVWSCFAKIDEKVVLSGQLVTEQGPLAVRSPAEGFIDTCFVERHQLIAKDDVICILVNKELSLQEAALRDRMRLLESQLASVQGTFALRESHLKRKIELDRELLDRLKGLQDFGAVQEFQVLQKELEASESISRLRELEEELERNTVSISLQLNDSRSALSRLKAQRDRFQVKAPSTGYIQQVTPRVSGEPLRSGEVLAELIPIDSLIAEVSAPSRLSSDLFPGESAKLSVDAFPAQDFGELDAVIRSISPTSDTSSSEPFFNVRLNILSAQSDDALPREDLQSGMGVTARITKRSRPVISFLFDFVDKIWAPINEER